eukprot:5250392-Prymnesium_polylepis.1
MGPAWATGHREIALGHVESHCVAASKVTEVGDASHYREDGFLIGTHTLLSESRARAHARTRTR